MGETTGAKKGQRELTKGMKRDGVGMGRGRQRNVRLPATGYRRV